MSRAASLSISETSAGKASDGPWERSWQEETEAPHRDGYLCHSACCESLLGNAVCESWIVSSRGQRAFTLTPFSVSASLNSILF